MTLRKNWLLFSAGIALGGSFLVLALRNVAPVEVLHILLRHANFWLAAPFLVCYTLFFWIKALRWRLLLSPMHTATASQLFPVTIVGYATNIVVPAQLGEVARSYVVGKRFRLNSSPVLATIVLERILDLMALSLFLEIVLMVSYAKFPSLRPVSYAIGGITLCGIVLLTLYLVRTQDVVAICRTHGRFLPTRLHKWLILQIERAALGLQALKDPKLILAIVVSTLAMWGAMALCTYLAIAAVIDSIPFSAAVVTLIVTVAGLMLPTSPGFLGTIQLCFLLALSPYALDPEEIIAASVFYNTLITVPPLLLGLFYVFHSGYLPGGMLRTARPQNDAPLAPPPADLTHTPDERLSNGPRTVPTAGGGAARTAISRCATLYPGQSDRCAAPPRSRPGNKDDSKGDK